jgi:hypothetical protein
MQVLPLLLLASASGLAQNPVTIHVNAAQAIGPYKPIYGYFGYDEPNYTYMANGRKRDASKEDGSALNLNSGGRNEDRLLPFGT